MTTVDNAPDQKPSRAPWWVYVIGFVAMTPLALPTLVAFWRRHHQRWAILILNTVGATTFNYGFADEEDVLMLIGFGICLAALVWSATAVKGR